MLAINKPENATPLLPKTGALDKGRLSAIIRRQYRALLAGLGIGVLLGTTYLLIAVPKFTAITEILIDSKRGMSLGLTNQAAQNPALDTAMVDSQVEILKSKKVAAAVLDDLKLTTPNPRAGLLTWLKTNFQPSWWAAKVAESSEVEKRKERDQVIDFLNRNLAIKRIGRTYVLEVAFTSPNPTEAAAIANSFTKAYRHDQAYANYEISRRASNWLLLRIEELKKKSLESDLAVEKFRIKKGLISTSQNGAQVLVNEQQLGQINTQLVTAKANTSNAKARYERIQSIVNTRQMDAAVSESLANPVIVDLRHKYLAASKTEEELSQRFGADHMQAVKLRADKKEFERLIFDELSRIAQSYKAEYDIASARESALEKALTHQVGVSNNENEEMVTLRELMRESDSYRNVYQSLLQLYHGQGQMQSFPVSEARVITAAIPPQQPSSPKRLLTLFISFLFGGALGIAIAAFREVRDRGFRTVAQVGECLGLEFLGMLPTLTKAQLDKSPGLPDDNSGLTPSALMRYSFKAPLSSFTETLRGAKVAVDLTIGDKKPKIIGVISVLPHEGKSTVSKNLASFVSYLGVRTVLIDADLRNPGLSRNIAPRAKEGLLEVLNDDRPYKEVLLTESETQLSVLPAVFERAVPYTSELLGSEAMGRFLSEAGKEYEYIFMDLPPLGPLVDARAVAKYCDAFILVIEWGKTGRDSAAVVLAQAEEVYAKCAGVILNKVDKKALALYESHGWREYYCSSYHSYYKDEG